MPLRRYIARILSLSLILILAGSCTSSHGIRVGVSMGPSNERWVKDADYLKQYLEARGAEVMVETAGDDEERQAEQAGRMIREGIGVLIIVPVNSVTGGQIVDRAKERGVKVIAYDRIVKDCDLDYYISFDNIRVGEMQADFLTRIKPAGRYAILGGDPEDNNSVLLRLGQMNVLQPLIIKGDIEVVVDRNVEQWDGGKAYEIIDEYLNGGGRLDAVIASNDALSGGACRAIGEHGLTGRVILSGQDAETDACRRIVRGEQTMTVYKVVESLAYYTAEIAIALASGETLPPSQTTVFNDKKMVPARLLSSMIPVSKENIRMTVIADGYLDEYQVFEQK